MTVTRPRAYTSDILSEFMEIFHKDDNQTELADSLYKIGVAGIDQTASSANTRDALEQTTKKCTVAMHNSLPKENQMDGFKTTSLEKQIDWLNKTAVTDDLYAVRVLEWSRHFI